MCPAPLDLKGNQIVPVGRSAKPVRVVEQIERFGDEVDPIALFEPELFAEPQVDILKAGPLNRFRSSKGTRFVPPLPLGEAAIAADQQFRPGP